MARRGQGSGGRAVVAGQWWQGSGRRAVVAGQWSQGSGGRQGDVHGWCSGCAQGGGTGVCHVLAHVCVWAPYMWALVHVP